MASPLQTIEMQSCSFELCCPEHKKDFRNQLLEIGFELREIRDKHGHHLSIEHRNPCRIVINKLFDLVEECNGKEAQEMCESHCASEIGEENWSLCSFDVIEAETDLPLHQETWNIPFSLSMPKGSSVIENATGMEKLDQATGMEKLDQTQNISRIKENDIVNCLSDHTLNISSIRQNDDGVNEMNPHINALSSRSDNVEVDESNHIQNISSITDSENKNDGLNKKPNSIMMKGDTTGAHENNILSKTEVKNVSHFSCMNSYNSDEIQNGQNQHSQHMSDTAFARTKRNEPELTGTKTLISFQTSQDGTTTEKPSASCLEATENGSQLSSNENGANEYEKFSDDLYKSKEHGELNHQIDYQDDVLQLGPKKDIGRVSYESKDTSQENTLTKQNWHDKSKTSAVREAHTGDENEDHPRDGTLMHCSSLDSKSTTRTTDSVSGLSENEKMATLSQKQLTSGIEENRFLARNPQYDDMQFNSLNKKDDAEIKSDDRSQSELQEKALRDKQNVLPESKIVELSKSSEVPQGKSVPMDENVFNEPKTDRVKCDETRSILPNIDENALSLPVETQNTGEDKMTYGGSQDEIMYTSPSDKASQEIGGFTESITFEASELNLALKCLDKTTVCNHLKTQCQYQSPPFIIQSFDRVFSAELKAFQEKIVTFETPLKNKEDIWTMNQSNQWKIGYQVCHNCIQISCLKDEYKKIMADVEDISFSKNSKSDRAIGDTASECTVSQSNIQGSNFTREFKEDKDACGDLSREKKTMIKSQSKVKLKSQEKDCDYRATLYFTANELELAKNEFDGKPIFTYLQKCTERNEHNMVELDDKKLAKELQDFQKQVITKKVSSSNADILSKIKATCQWNIAFQSFGNYILLSALDEVHRQLKLRCDFLYSPQDYGIAQGGAKTAEGGKSEAENKTKTDKKKKDKLSVIGKSNQSSDSSGENTKESRGILSGMVVGAFESVVDRFYNNEPKDSFKGDNDQDLTVRVYKGDIRWVDADVIVNATNKHMISFGGASKVISEAAGKKLKDECRKHIEKNRSFDFNELFVSTAGNLKAKKVYHIMAPKWSLTRGEEQCKQDLRTAILRCLIRAEQDGYKSIALTSIGAAILGIPKDICVDSYLKSVRVFETLRPDQNSGHLKKVHFVDIDAKMVDLIQKHFSDNRNMEVDTVGELRQEACLMEESFRTTSKKKKAASKSDSSGNKLIKDKESFQDTSKTAGRETTFGSNSKNLLDEDQYRSPTHRAGSNSQRSADRKSYHPQPSAPPAEEEDLNPSKDAYYGHYPEALSLAGAYGGDRMSPITHNQDTNPEALHDYDNHKSHYVNVSELKPYPTLKAQHCADRLPANASNHYLNDRDLHGSHERDHHRMPATSSCRYSNDSDRYKRDRMPEASKSSVGSGRDVTGHTLTSKDSSFSDVVSRRKTDTAGSALLSETDARQYPYDADICEICCQKGVRLKKLTCCEKLICKECLGKCKRCPYCRESFETLRGDQPSGFMSVKKSSEKLEGYRARDGCFKIEYYFYERSSINPYRTAYIPNNSEGQKALKRLMVAFMRGLTFTRGTSVTTGRENQIVWNGIHHKTSMVPNHTFGYPDHTYLDRLYLELVANGVKEASFDSHEERTVERCVRELTSKSKTNIVYEVPHSYKM